MRKSIFTILLAAIVALSAYATVVPENYYSSADGKADSLLKVSLYEISKGGKRVSYGTQGYTYPDNIYYPASWNYFPLTDQRSDGTIWDMYSDTKRYYPYDGGSAGGIQIEHCIPKSWWGWTKSDTASSKRAYQDLYILNPADAQANGQKSNYPPGHVQKGDKFDNGSFRMDKAGSSEQGWICFEPAAEYRGDFARTYFYAVTAYQDLPWGAGNKDYQRYVTEDSYVVFRDWLIEVLLDWHRSDPVSRKEIERASAIYDVQGNRNPYIDYPELVEYIWGNKKGEPIAISRLECTFSDTYVPKEDYTNFAAYTPKDYTESGFTAQWLNYQTAYTLDVYTKQTTGRNDTLINLPSVTAKKIEATANMRYVGKLNSAGTNGVVLGSGGTDGGVVLYDLDLRSPADLYFRANMYQTATNGEIRIFYDNHSEADSILYLPTSRDETFYHIEIPEGIDSIRIISYGGSTSKRACLHELYLTTGDWQQKKISIEGYPKEIEENYSNDAYCGYYVAIPGELSQESIYYRVSTEDGRVSNEVKADRPSSPDGMPYPTTSNPKSRTRKILHKGNVYIQHENEVYTVSGQQRSRLR